MLACSKIRKHINQLSDRELFKSRDLLVYGSRSVVDWLLHKLCKAGAIIREARGVYRKNSGWCGPSVTAVALFKAGAFGRRIVQDFRDSAADLQLRADRHSQLVFITDGASSSFATTAGVRIYFHNRTARKVGLHDGDPILRTIKALWHCGEPLDPVDLAAATRHFGREENRALRNSAPLMPAWMANLLTGGGTGKRISRAEFEQAQRAQERRRQLEWFREFMTRPASSPANHEGKGDQTVAAPPGPDHPIDLTGGAHLGLSAEEEGTYDGELGYDGDCSYIDSDGSSQSYGPHTQ